MPSIPASPIEHRDDDSTARVEVRHSDPDYAAVVVLLGEHDIATEDAVRAALAPLYGRMLVDLSACTFIDSTVIGLLLERLKQLDRDGQSLELLTPTVASPVTHSLRLVGISRLMPVHDGRDGKGPVAPATRSTHDGQEDQMARVKQGSRIKTKDGKPGRVQRLDADDSIAYFQLDEHPTPDDGTPIDVHDLELIPPE